MQGRWRKEQRGTKVSRRSSCCPCEAERAVKQLLRQHAIEISLGFGDIEVLEFDGQGCGEHGDQNEAEDTSSRYDLVDAVRVAESAEEEKFESFKIAN